MNYIIFGGSGFIGTHLIHLLKNEVVTDKDKIYVLDIVMPGEEGVVPGIVEKNEGVEYVRLDVEIQLILNLNRQMAILYLILLLYIELRVMKIMNILKQI